MFDRGPAAAHSLVTSNSMISGSGQRKQKRNKRQQKPAVIGFSNHEETTCNALFSRKLTWKPKRGPIKTTVPLKWGCMGFHVNLGDLGWPLKPFEKY